MFRRLLDKLKLWPKKGRSNGFAGVRAALDPIDFENWQIEFNYPFGFVVRNLKTPEEFHFQSKSDGWVTSRHRTKQSDAVLCYSTRSLLTGQYYPNGSNLVDRESTKEATRVLELQSKKELTPAEKDELLERTGLRAKA